VRADSSGEASSAGFSSGGVARLPRIYVHPGQIMVTPDPMHITTILGSCVAVCLWDPGCGAGGLAHFVLPDGCSSGSARLRFGAAAIEELLRRLVELGSGAERLQAKLFGGACVLRAFRRQKQHLGLRNVEVARGDLARRSIPVVAEDVGGNHGRKLVFHPHDGAAWVKTISSH
jgi:chemotaxis protein CheD